MAQHRKATEDAAREELREAVAFAEQRVQRAREQYKKGATVDALREKMVAEDEFRNLSRELRQHDDDRDPAAIRRADAHPRRTRPAWPVGKPESAPRPPRREVIARTVTIERVTPATVTNPEPVKAEPSRSWWVGADRRQLQIGSRALAKRPPAKTAKPQTKAQIKSVEQERNDAKRDARKLAERLKPSAGAFSSIPMAE